MRRKILKKGQTPDQFHTQLYDKITRIEAQVLERIQKLKTSSKSYVCEHFSIPSPECQPFDENVNYYDKFWKRFLLNEIGKQNVVQFEEQLEFFKKKVNKIESLFQERSKQLEPVLRSKRSRSSKYEDSHEGQHHNCDSCDKVYNERSMLHIHRMSKHRESSQGQLESYKHKEDDIFEEESDK